MGIQECWDMIKTLDSRGCQGNDRLHVALRFYRVPYLSRTSQQCVFAVCWRGSGIRCLKYIELLLGLIVWCSSLVWQFNPPLFDLQIPTGTLCQLWLSTRPAGRAGCSTKKWLSFHLWYDDMMICMTLWFLDYLDGSCFKSSQKRKKGNGNMLQSHK